MKTFLKNQLIVIIALLLTGCLKNEPTTISYYSFATFKDTTSTIGYYIKLDNKNILEPNNRITYNDSIVNNSRVVATYNFISSDSNATNVKYKVEMLKLEPIYTKNITQLTNQNADSIGNDPINIINDNIWVTDNYLNVIYGFVGGSSIHYINLVIPDSAKTDTLNQPILEFRHNRNNDWASYNYSYIIAFKLDQLEQPGADSTNFIFKWINYDNDTCQKILTVYFNNTQQKKAINQHQIVKLPDTEIFKNNLVR